MTPWPPGPWAASPTALLWRTFLAQFLASESVSSDVQLRRTLIWGLAFLLTPCLYLTAIVLPTFEIVRLVAAARNAPEMVEQMLSQLAVIYVSYSMVTTGLIAVFVWDALNVERRDAMVLGPLPVGELRIVCAKLGALGAFLLGTAFAVNLSAGIPYALITGGNGGVAQVARHLFGYLAGTMGSATFVASVMVGCRGLLLAGGARWAASAGSILQFLCVSAVLCFLLVPAAMGKTQPVVFAATAADWMPTNWYFGLFERLRGNPRAELVGLAHRAVTALFIAVAGSIAVTWLGVRRQMQAAVAPPPRAGVSPLLWVRRRVGRLIVGSDEVARGVLEFLLVTLGRNRDQQAYVGVGAAVAVGVASVGLSRDFDGMASLMQPRTVVLWIPLLFGYWMALGLRASFFVPSEWRAAWAFQTNARGGSASYWSATRATVVAVIVVPAILLNVGVIAPLLGWQIAAFHTLVVVGVLVVTADVVALSIDFIPYTRVYEPGHARLKTRWPLYVMGMFLVAYVPVRLELSLLRAPSALAWLVGAIGIAIAAAELGGQRIGREWTTEPDVPDDDPDAATVLNLSGV